jgi:hypothetical protein
VKRIEKLSSFTIPNPNYVLLPDVNAVADRIKDLPVNVECPSCHAQSDWKHAKELPGACPRCGFRGHSCPA